MPRLILDDPDLGIKEPKLILDEEVSPEEELPWWEKAWGTLEKVSRPFMPIPKQPEEEPTWWEKAKETVVKGYEWLYPEGIVKGTLEAPKYWGKALEKVGLATGEGATWIARNLCPGQEDLPSYEEQSIPRQALTLAQGASVVALATIIGDISIKALSSLAKSIAYGKVSRIADKVATEHFTKIKTTNPEVKTLEDAKALVESSLRTITSAKIETTYLPTTIRELGKLSKQLLKPLPAQVPTAEFKAQLGKQVTDIVTSLGKTSTPEIIKPFTQMIEQAVGAPATGVITPEFGKVAVDVINKDFPMMLNELIAEEKVTAPLKPELIPEEKIVEEEMVKPLTPTVEEYVAPEIPPEVKPTVPEEIPPIGVEEKEYQAKVLADIEKEQATIVQQVKAKGGIKYTPAVKDFGNFNEIPLAAKKKDGLPFDEMADELKMTENELWEKLTTPKVKIEIPSYLEYEMSMGGGPTLGSGIELTTKELFTEPKEKNPLGKAVDAVTNVLSVYTKVKKEFPEAYEMFRHFKGGQELAWINANEQNKEIWGKISSDEALAIQRHRQNPEKYPLESLPEKLWPVAKKLDTSMEASLKEFIDMGKMTKGWPQSYIELLNKEKEKLFDEIASLKQQKAIVKRQTRVKEIDELVKVLETRRFFPGRYLNTPEGQAALLKFLPEGRFRASQIRERWIKGKTIPDIDAAIEVGLEPLDPRAASLDYLFWKEIEKNKWVLYQGLKDNPNLVLKEKEAPEWWNETTGLPALKGYKINPIISDVLREFEKGDTRKGIHAAYMKVARWGKIASFYNPIIMGGIYDPQQGYMAAGLKVFNPILYVNSIKSITTQDEFYKKCVGANLFPKPVDLGPQRNMDELVLSAAKQMDESTPKFTALIEKLTDGKWNFKGGENTKNIIKAISGLYSAEWNLTWNLDAASRMNTVKVLLAKGWDFEKAVERARFYHADYGDIPGDTRRFLNMVMWTPSYQISMGKVYANMAAHPVKEKGPLARLIGFWLLAATGAAIAGYRWTGGYRFVKDISKTEEEVISAPGPLFWLNKTLTRNPIVGAYWQSAVPVNIFLSLYKNYDGLGARVYDPKASRAMQIGQMAEFAIERYFRPLEAARRLTDTERNLLDRLLHLVAVSKYQRTKREKKKPEYEKYWWR